MQVSIGIAYRLGQALEIAVSKLWREVEKNLEVEDDSAG